MPNFEHFNRQKTAFRHFERNQFERGAYRYGFGGWTFDLDARFGTDTQTELGAVGSWRDTISGITFVQGTAGSKPRYRAGGVGFNNFPVVEWQTTPRFLLSDMGVGIDQKKTLVIVYKKLGDGNLTSPYEHSIFSTAGNQVVNEAFATRTSFGSEVGLWAFQGTNNTSATPFDTNEHIIVIGENGYIADGASIHSSVTLPVNASFFYLGGINNRSVPTFYLTRILVGDIGTPTNSDLIRLCNNINTDYSVY